MHTALYRKKRPTSFGDVIGQQPIVTTLCNQLKSGHISHAYLFCGTRGTGKTSTAKIFARAVNCPMSAETGEPCNTCEACKDILAERNLNVIEIDAASNNGVDNIRDLREEVKYPPTTGTYKVYIVDEAHMLTTAAFNALLKTLEEPPEHIIFILATTDPQKIPATILSRCQRYDFKRITRNDMVNTLASYMENEGIKTDKDALEYIASVSDGAMRDALSILDQCLSLYAGEAITLNKVQNLLGAVDQSALFAYGKALLQNDSGAALTIIAQASKEGRDLSRFTADIITHFRNLLVASQVANHSDILDYSPETIERYRAQSTDTDPISLINYIREFSELQNQMRYLPQERLALEVCTIKLCAQSLKPLTASPVTKEIVEEPSNPIIIEEKAKETQIPVHNEVNEAVAIVSGSSAEVFDISNQWKDFCLSLSGLLKSMLSLCEAECRNNNITIICRDQGSLQYMKDHQSTITSELTKYFKLPETPIIVFIVNDGYNDTDTFKENIQTQINIPVEFE